MSGSEPGIMSGRESFGIGLHKNSNHPSQSSSSVIPSMRLAYSADGTAVYKPVLANSPPPYQTTSNTGGGGGGGSSDGGNNNNSNTTGSIIQHGINMNMGGEPMKRKRGRPRKYGPDGTMALALTPASASASPTPPQPVQQQPEFSPSMASAATAPASESSIKKARGRPPGSANKKQQQQQQQQVEAIGSAGLGFTPHVITVKAGEDVSSKIISFSQIGPRTVCILSANGAISNVTLRQAATSGGTVTYEGRFEILSLSGSFLLSESGGQRSRTGGLSVSLAGPDGRVLGGGVAGLLTAASPVQVVVGSFLSDTRKDSKSLINAEPSSAPSKYSHGGGAAGTGSPPSRGTMSESSGGAGSPLNHSTGACNNNASGMSNMPWK